ncbi:MAG: hypothetical protein EOM87_00495, partial [Clostridia bacterium]|nr:hypothetical protein [Clostridia bacterium]
MNINNKKLTFLFVLFLAFAVCLIVPMGQLNTASAISPPAELDGSGTLEDPYIIDEAGDLALLRDAVNFATAYVELSVNINLSEAADFENFTAAFGGTFDGKGNALSNFSVTTSTRNLGFFSQLTSSATVKNLKIEAGNVSSTLSHPSSGVGILAGTSAGIIQNVHTTGTVSGRGSVGGLVGTLTAGSITACSSSATINGSSVGGIAGRQTGGAIAHCYSIGNITAASSGGGIVGDLLSGAISYSFNRSKIVKVDELDDSCFIGHIAGSSMVEFADNFYFDVEDNAAVNSIGAFGNDFDEGDVPGAATLVDETEGKTSFILTLNNNGAYWAYGTTVEDGYPTLRSKYNYISIGASDTTYTYTKDVPQEIVLAAAGYEGGFKVYYYGATFNNVSYALSETAPINAGIYSVYAKPTEAGTIGCIADEYVIEKANLTSQYSLNSKLDSTYTGATQTLEILDGDSAVPDWEDLGLDEPTYAYYRIEGEQKIAVSNYDAKDVATYEVVATIEGGNNYNNLTGDDALVATLEITKATLYMQVDDKYAVYGSTISVFTVSVSGFVAEEYPAVCRNFVAPTAIYADAELPTAAGTYTKKILIDLAGSAHNYAFVPAPNADPEDLSPEGAGTLYITKANISGVTFSGVTVVYNGNARSITINGSLPEGTVVSYALDAVEPDWQALVEKTEAGSYRILAKVDAGNNYNTLNLAADLIISKADITGVTLDDITVTYDGTAKTATIVTSFSYTITYVKGGVPSFDAPIAAGFYPIYADITGGNNYKDLRLDATLSILKFFVRVVADNVSTVYGEEQPSSFTISYFNALGQSLSSVPGSLGASVDCDFNQAAGAYPITVAVIDESNFAVIKTNGVYTVEKAELTVSVVKERIAYNTPIPSFTLQYSGFVNGENQAVVLSAPLVSTTAIQGDDVGEYYVTLSGGEINNYFFNLMSGYQLIIEKTDRTGITFASVTAVFDGRSKEISASYTGDCSITYNGSSVKPVTVGVYNAVLFIADSKNYYSYTATARLTINKASIVVSSSYPVTTFGDAYQAITLNYNVLNTSMTDELMNYIDASYTCAVNADNATQSPAGAYEITVSCVANENLVISTVNGMYSINKALLTVTVLSKTYKYNQDISALEFDITGFKGADTIADLSIAPTLSAQPSKGDNAAVYPVYVSGAAADNYSFKYVHGYVAIDKASFTTLYNLTDMAVTFDGLNKTLALKWADERPDAVTFEATFVVTGGSVTETDAGVYPVNISIEDTAGNYEFMTFNSTLTIAPRTLTVSGTSAIERIYNGSTLVTLENGILLDGENLFLGAGVTLQLGFGTMQSKTAGLNKPVTTNVTLAGNQARNYVVTQPEITVNILPKSLTINNLLAVSRPYNGSDQIAFDFSEIEIIGIEVSDDVIIDTSNSFGTTSNANVGNNKAVTTNIILTGADCDNYTVVQPSNVTVSIMQAHLLDTASVYENASWFTVLSQEFSGIYNNEERTITYAEPVFTFNGTPNTLPLLAGLALSGVSWTVDGDTVTAAGQHTVTITILSPDGNFFAETITVSFTVAPRVINISSLLASGKVYDGTTAASLSSYISDILPSSDATVIATAATFASGNIGDHTVTFTLSLTGADADNYIFMNNILPSTAVSSITARPVTITGVTALDKIYDGTTTVTLQGGELQNVINGELSFTLGAGVLDNADAGANKGVTTYITLTGDQVGNYSFTQPDLTVTIAKKELTVTAASHTMSAKTELPELSYISVGLVEGDTFTGNLTVNSDGRKTGTYAITLGTLSAGDNYDITYIEGALTVKTPVYVWVLVG